LKKKKEVQLDAGYGKPVPYVTPKGGLFANGETPRKQEACNIFHVKREEEFQRSLRTQLVGRHIGLSFWPSSGAGR
jgi:hypothetical protein